MTLYPIQVNPDIVLYSITPKEISSIHCKDKTPKFRNKYPRKGISGSQSQFPHSCVCERFIYSQDRSAYSAGGNMYTDPGTI